MVVTVAEMRKLEKTLFSGDYPVTIFSFNDLEERKYNDFFNYYSSHEKRMKEIGHYNVQLNRQEEMKGQRELTYRFLELIGDYLESKHIFIDTFFAGYGGSHEMMVSTKYYPLFDKNDSRKDLFKINLDFKARENELTCKSRLNYSNLIDKHRINRGRMEVLYDFSDKILGSSGEESPYLLSSLFSRKGDFMYFAPLDDSIRVMSFYMKLIDLIGEERMEELTGLREDYTTSWTEEPNKKEERQHETFKRVYLSSLEEDCWQIKEFVKSKDLQTKVLH